MWVEIDSAESAFVFKYLFERVDRSTVRAIPGYGRLDNESSAHEVQRRENEASHHLGGNRNE